MRFSNAGPVRQQRVKLAKKGAASASLAAEDPVAPFPALASPRRGGFTKAYTSSQLFMADLPKVAVTDSSQENIMNKLWIPALLVSAVFSANAFADHDWDEHEYHHHHHHYRGEYVVVQPAYAQPQVVYQAPPVVYQAPPQVVVQERVVYRDRPVYYDAGPRYAPPQPVYQRYEGNRAVGQVVGAVAGGLLGNGVGKGNGRVAATAVGAVIGSVVGGNMATGYGY